MKNNTSASFCVVHKTDIASIIPSNDSGFGTDGSSDSTGSAIAEQWNKGTLRVTSLKVGNLDGVTKALVATMGGSKEHLSAAVDSKRGNARSEGMANEFRSGLITKSSEFHALRNAGYIAGNDRRPMPSDNFNQPTTDSFRLLDPEILKPNVSTFSKGQK